MTDPTDPMPHPLAYENPSAGGTDAPGRLREVALLFARLGFTAFGGPAVHTAMMEDEVVRRRGWLDRTHFLDLVGTLNFIPGPNSTELAIHLGLIRAGLRGLVVAGACFITPAVLIILPMAWAYVRYGRVYQVQGVMRGVGGAVVAIIAVAGWRFGRTAVRDRFTAAVAVGTLAGEWALRRFWPAAQPELVLLAAAGVLGVAWYGRPAWARVRDAARSVKSLPLLLFVPLARAGRWAIWAPLAVAVPGSGSPWYEVGRLGLFFLRIGATLFGSGYVLVSYLQSGLVDRPGGAWLTQQQLLDAIAVGQVTPGPLLTTATFVGYVRGYDVFGGSVAGGVLGGVVATVAIFFPSFVLVAGFGRLLPRLRANPHARAALDAINAAVAAMVLSVAARLAWGLQSHGRPDWLRVGLAVACLVALLRWNINSTWLIVGAALVGWAGQAAGIG